ncbi:MAG: hypothetical protein ACUVSQ_06670 [Pseudanabaenaceae cyanobacterium]
MKVLGNQHNGFWGDRPVFSPQRLWRYGLLAGGAMLLWGPPVAAAPPPRSGDAARLGGSLEVTMRLAPLRPGVPAVAPFPSLPQRPVVGPLPLDPAARLPGTFATDPVPAVPLVWDTGRETRTLNETIER